MIIFAFGDALPYTKGFPAVKKNQVPKRNCKTALNLAREYYYDKNLKKRDVRPTKLVALEGIARHQSLNIMLYEPRKGRGKDAGSVWQ